MRNIVFLSCFAGVVSISILFSSMANAQESPRGAVTQNCEDLNYSIKREGSPFHYTNPNEGCGITLKLDGLPNKSGSGYSNSGNDACRAVRNAVSDLQGKLNERLQSALGKVGDVVSPDELEAIAGSAGVDVSGVTNVMRDGIDYSGTLDGELTETMGSLATKEGREQMADDIGNDALERTGTSLQESSTGQMGTTATPGINGSASGQGGSGNSDSDSSWSIFD